jgi:hypothetical protein
VGPGLGVFGGSARPKPKKAATSAAVCLVMAVRKAQEDRARGSGHSTRFRSFAVWDLKGAVAHAIESSVIKRLQQTESVRPSLILKGVVATYPDRSYRGGGCVGISMSNRAYAILKFCPIPTLSKRRLRPALFRATSAASSTKR